MNFPVDLVAYFAESSFQICFLKPVDQTSKNYGFFVLLLCSTKKL